MKGILKFLKYVYRSNVQRGVCALRTNMLRTEKQEAKLQHDVRNDIKAYCFEGEWDYTVVLQNIQGKPLV